MYAELDTREERGYRVSLEWDRDTGGTQIVMTDLYTADRLAFVVPGAIAGAAYRDPFRYAP